MAITHKIELYINNEFIFRGDLDQLVTPPQYISILTSQLTNDGNVTINEISANHNIYNDWSPVLTVGTEVDRGILSTRGSILHITDSSADRIVLSSEASDIKLSSSSEESGINDVTLSGEV
jgi:hypothetical protein